MTTISSTPTTTIFVSLGKKEYVGGTIEETTGKDISSATITVGLSESDKEPPTTWVAPDVDDPGPVSVRTVKLLIASQDEGTFYVWANIADSPEIIPFVLDPRPVVIK